MKRHFSVSLAAGVAVVALALLAMSVQAQSSTPPQPHEIALQDTAGATRAWQTFSTTGFLIRYPTDWHMRLLPAQLIDTQAVEFYHSTPDNLVDASISVYETRLAPDENWQQDPELLFWREQGAQIDHPSEAVLVNGDTGWLVRSQRSSFLSGDLTRAVFVARNGRLYRFRLRLFQDQPLEPDLRIFGLMLGTLQSTPNVGMSPKTAPTPSNVTKPLLPRASDPKAVSAGAYNRGAAYAYAATWWNQRNNSDGCYLWYNGSVLDCVQNAGDYGVDGAHFVNRAVWAGGRPIPQLLPSYPAEARSVSALRTWLINDGWTSVSANQAQVGDVVIIGNQCWTGLVVVPGNPPTVATHSDELWVSAASLQCGGNSSKEYLHAPQGNFYGYLPLVLNKYPIPIKVHSGMHLGSRGTGSTDLGWTDAMLQPIDGDNGGIWPTSIVVLSDQIYNLGRPDNPPSGDPYCKIAFVDLNPKSTVVFDYMKRAANAGVKVIIRVHPSPGNFPDWSDPTQPNHHLMISTPADGGDYCHQNRHERDVRHVGDIVKEIAQIHEYNVRFHGFHEYAFIPANEPNREWYTKDMIPNVTAPAIKEPVAWQEMDAYFAQIYTKVQAITPPADLINVWGTIWLLTPPMAQEGFAEGIDPVTCNQIAGQDVLIDGTSGYANMTTTYQTANDGITWHNYWRWTDELSGGCAFHGDHLSTMAFPDWMRSAMQHNPGGDTNFVIEADLASPDQMKHTNPLTTKDFASIAAESTRTFFYWEQGALPNSWLLSYQDNPGEFSAEIHWHEAYSMTIPGFRSWFSLWWPGSETPADLATMKGAK